MKIMAKMQIPLSNKLQTKENSNWKMSLAEKITGRSLGDFGDPEDIAETASFLASPKSRYMTGACIDVNGGLL